MFGLEHPIAQAPMAGVSGGRLAAAVSNAGGLGLVGGGYGDPEWMTPQLSLAAEEARRPWGVGLITWRASHELLDFVLGHRPSAVMLSFGDPAPYAAAIEAAGARLICQVTDLREAEEAAACGADVIVAQGTEAGGHGGGRSTLPLVPAVVDAVAPVPVLAAGGIADGRGLAAALMLGAHGVLLGTRFYASHEALGHPRVKQRLVEATGEQTERTRVFDAARGLTWPAAYTGRALRNAFLRRWTGHEDELRDNQPEQQAFRGAVADGDTETAMVWASEGVDLISGLERAEDLVTQIGAEAEKLLQTAPTRWTH
ncbi:MAG: nitronate monooxygenase [Streptosporangiales bacterium]|nr:nitronate monooxygenase [Streptosporangiales bacterium]